MADTPVEDRLPEDTKKATHARRDRRKRQLQRAQAGCP